MPSPFPSSAPTPLPLPLPTLIPSLRPTRIPTPSCRHDYGSYVDTVDAAGVLRDNALTVVYGYDKLAENIYAVSKDLSHYAIAAFVPNATNGRIELAESLANDYIDFLAHIGIVAVFCYAALGIVASCFCIEMQSRYMKFTSNLLMLNNFVGVFYLIIVAAVLCFEMFLGLSVTSFCLSSPDDRTIQVLDHWPGKTTAAAEILKHYIYCDTLNPFDVEYNTMSSSANVINRSVTEYLRYRTRRPCNETLTNAFFKVQNESNRLFNILDNFAEDFMCSSVHPTYELLVEEQICSGLVDSLQFVVLSNLVMMILLFFVMICTSFQRQTILESRIAKPGNQPGHSLPLNFNSMQTISKTNNIYYANHLSPKAEPEHALASKEKDDIHWTWNPDI